MEVINDQEKKPNNSISGLLFVGCMFIGMATGWYFDKLPIGLFGGMGLGFIMMAVAKRSDANKK